MPDVVNMAFEPQLYTTTSTAASATTTSSSCASEMTYDESDGSESATPDMDSQLLYVKLKEVTTTTSTTTTTTTNTPCSGKKYVHTRNTFCGT